MLLLFDIRNPGTLTFVGVNEEGVMSIYTAPGKTRDLLETLQTWLQSNGWLLSDITGIAVTLAVGSFTDTRLAVTVANTLGFALKIPVVGIPPEEAEDIALWTRTIREAKVGVYISATYSADPHIGGVRQAI